MQAYLLLSPYSVEGGGGGVSTSSNFKAGTLLLGSRICEQRLRTKQQNRSAINCRQQQQDHYAVLGLSSTASSSDIKRAYRLLARKFHPDVSKDLQAGEVFKSIRLAYDVLSNEDSRIQYDYTLKFQEGTGRSRMRNWVYDLEDEERTRIYRWEELRRQIRREKYWRQYEASEQDPSSSVETEDMDEEETSEHERGSFSEVVKSTLFLLFFVRTLGAQVSLILCSLSAFFDKKLDAGYKVGYLIACILGGRGGILLSLCLTFASWLCGKTSSSYVVLVVVAMWVSTNLARYVAVPQGALIALLYMSVKLQDELS